MVLILQLVNQLAISCVSIMLIFRSEVSLPFPRFLPPPLSGNIYWWWVISRSGHLWLLVTNTRWSVTRLCHVTWQFVTMTPPQHVTMLHPGSREVDTRDEQARSDALELLEEDATFVVTKQLMTTTFTITRWFRNLFSTMTLASLTPSFKHLENWKGGFELRVEAEWNCRLLLGNATSGCTVHSAPLFRVPSS